MGEGDLLVTLLTRDGSKLRAMAWGARKLTSRKMGHLEPLTLVDLALSKTRGIDGITQAQSLETFAVLKSSLEATAKAFYLSELVDGFALEGGPNPPMYDLFLGALRAVQDSADDSAVVLRFQLNLLQVNGFMPELYRCVDCRRRILPGDHRFSVSLGGALCSGCAPPGAAIAPLSLNAMKALRHFHRNPAPDAPRLRIPPALYEEIKSLLDGAVRYWLDRDIRSAKFMEHVDGRKAKTLHPNPSTQGV